MGANHGRGASSTAFGRLISESAISMVICCFFMIQSNRRLASKLGGRQE